MLFICFSISVCGQVNVNQRAKPSIEKTAGVDVRIPSKDKITEYQQDDRFQYENIEKGSSMSLLDKLKYWLDNLLDKLFSGAAKSGIPSIIIIIIIVVVIILVILKLMGVKFKTLFGKKKMDTPEIDIYTENVHAMNFDSLINNALKNKDYRLAVRFLYLKNLKLLSDKNIIKWNVNKTNYSYQYEIKDHDLRSKYIETTFIFDYIWYGEFSLDENKFMEINDRMSYFNKTVSNER